MAEGKIRTATLADIPELVALCGSVNENRLSDPAKVKVEEYRAMIELSEVWVWDDHQRILGFSAAKVCDGSIWALFVTPDQDGKGIGRSLLECACRTLKRAGIVEATLSTEADNRAARFYVRAGWADVGRTPDGEIVFKLRL